MLDIVFALLSGVGVGVVLDLWIKAAREKSSIASLLLGEIIQNNKYVNGYLKLRAQKPRHIYPEFNIPTTAFDAVLNRLGELPTDLIGRVLQTYRNVADANRVAGVYHSLVREYRDLSPTDPRREGVAAEIGETVDAFWKFVETIPPSTKDMMRPLSDLVLSGRPILRLKYWLRRRRRETIDSAQLSAASGPSDPKLSE